MNVIEGSEAKISNFKIEVFVYKDVLELEISMNNFLPMHVWQNIEHLMHEEATTVFSHST